MFMLKHKVRPMNHMGKLETFYSGYPVQTVKEKCGWQKVETKVLLVSHEFLKFIFQEKKN